MSTARKLPEAILALLRRQDGEFVSGEEISRQLGVSRTAIWKQIGALRNAGYLIEAQPARGYRLSGSSDVLRAEEIQAGLRSLCVARELYCLGEIDSTNSEAQRLAAAGAAEGATVLAEQQSRGKGRMGRQWLSPPGVNLYTSIVLRPAIAPYQAPQLTFVSAVATALAIREVCGLEATVKWPNDILVHGRKVAGLLNEMSAESERIHYVVLGIGINVNMRAEQLRGELRYPATSLSLEAGRAWSRAALARRLYESLDHWYQLFLAEGFAPLRHQWLQLCPWQGQPIEVDQGHVKLRGTFAGLDDSGALLLASDKGERQSIHAGDVRLL